MVKYHLVENPLTEKAHDFMAQTQSAATFDMDAVIRWMLQKGTLVSMTDIVAVLNAYQEAVVEIVQRGRLRTVCRDWFIRC